jgi:3-oxoacyl-[acyl-carrier protein] reductase
MTAAPEPPVLQAPVFQDPVFQDRVALVTGASSGIGAATARTLAARGATVVVNYHHGKDRAAELVDSVVADGGRAVAIGADVTDAGQVRDLVEQAEASAGPIDILVLNATGLYGPDVQVTPVAQIPADYLERVVLSQVRSLLHPVQAVLPGMLARGHGSIVAVGAALSRSPAPGFVALSMAKAALEVAVRTLAKEVGPHGVRVNAVGPGLILTESTKYTPDAMLAANAQEAAVRRNGLPQDVAEVIAFLASDRTSYLTGGFLLVDGGTAML